MKVSVFGLGYVGTVTAACLAADGNDVVGVDTNATKVALINAGKSPIIEAKIGPLIQSTVANGKLCATEDAANAVQQTDVSLVCVGTPSQLNGNLDLSYVRRVCEDIGNALASKLEFHVVVLRSTMLPGSMRGLAIPTLEDSSGKAAGESFGVCNNPEFLREGTAVDDYHFPPKIVIGETDTRAGDALVSLYESIDAPLFRTSIETAEMVKYADNSWHATKVVFANEVGNVCKSVGVDSHKVMRIFCEDTKLNLSRYYMTPGFAFGGSCLPKDVRALTYKARSMDVDTPLLNSLIMSNEEQVRRAIAMVVNKGNRRIGFLGFSFKAGTDDLRESPVVSVIEYLIGKGYELCLYDENVRLAKLGGANKDYILNHIPHISRLMVDTSKEVVNFAETLVVGVRDERIESALQDARDEQEIVDLVRSDAAQDRPKYDGICW